MFCEIPEFGRCCFCLPLRRGVLVFGYINVLFSACMVGVYSYFTNADVGDSATLVYHGIAADSMVGWCIAIYCIELLVNCVLVLGAHTKNILYLKIFYYYAITTTLAGLVLEVVSFTRLPHAGRMIEMAVLTFAALCINMYLIFLVRSLLKKLEIGDDHSYDNQLHTIVSGEAKVDNGVYNNTTVIPLDN